MPHLEDLAAQLFGKSCASLGGRTQKVARHVVAFGGSWTFVGVFVGAVLAWRALNGVLLAMRGATFDPCPYPATATAAVAGAAAGGLIRRRAVHPGG